MAAPNHKTLALALSACVFGALLFSPVTILSARADDDDWEDRWEDYYEELEERREEARERWEDRDEEIAELREKGFLVPYGGWHEHYVPNYGHRVYRQPQPGVQYYEYYDDPTHNPYYLPPPNRYEAYRPAYRYYGTPQIGYYDFGRGGAVRVGPIQVFWD